MLEIIPTTTFPDLTRNNTSASDFFPGWINGVAKPANVSPLPLDIPQVTIQHDMGWFGSTSHPNVGYNAADPAYCTKNITVKRVRGSSISEQYWCGPNSFEHKSALAMKAESEKQGTKIMLCVSGPSTPELKLQKAVINTITVAQRTLILNGLLDQIRTIFFSSPAYFRTSFEGANRPMLAFFGLTAIDRNAVKAHVSGWGADRPTFSFRHKKGYTVNPLADSVFGWRDNDPAWVAEVTKLYPGKIIILGVCGGFDSSHSELPIHCTWGNSDITQQRGGLELMDQLALCRANPQIKFAKFVYNDKQEGRTDEEGYASGKTVTLSEAGGVLSWTDAGPVFDHYRVLVSNDNKGWMDLPGAEKVNGTSFDLSAIDFPDQHTYYFAVQAVGRPLIQNLLSNAIAAPMGWGTGVAA